MSILFPSYSQIVTSLPFFSSIEHAVTCNPNVGDYADGEWISSFCTDECNNETATGSTNGQICVSQRFFRLLRLSEGRLQVWNTRSQAQRIRLDTLHQGWISSLEFCDLFLISASCDDETIRVWDRMEGVALRRISAPGLVWSIAVAPERQWVSAACQDSVSIWDVNTGQLLRMLYPGFTARQVALSLDEMTLLCGGDGGLMRYDITSTRVVEDLELDPSKILIGPQVSKHALQCHMCMGDIRPLNRSKSTQFRAQRTAAWPFRDRWKEGQPLYGI